MKLVNKLPALITTLIYVDISEKYQATSIANLLHRRAWIHLYLRILLQVYLRRNP